MGSTPVVDEVQETMDFPEAMRSVSEGKRIQRLAWPEDEYCYFKDDFLFIHRDGKDFYWTISKGDVVEEDWVSF